MGSINVLCLSSEKIVNHNFDVFGEERYNLEWKYNLQAEKRRFVILMNKNSSIFNALSISDDYFEEMVNKSNGKTCQMVPDYLLLNWKPGTISVALKDDLVVVRYGLMLGFALSTLKAWMLIRKIQSEASSEMPVVVLRPVELIPLSLMSDQEILATSIDWNSRQPKIHPQLLINIFSKANWQIGSALADAKRHKKLKMVG